MSEPSVAALTRKLANIKKTDSKKAIDTANQAAIEAETAKAELDRIIAEDPTARDTINERIRIATKDAIEAIQLAKKANNKSIAAKKAYDEVRMRPVQPFSCPDEASIEQYAQAVKDSSNQYAQESILRNKLSKLMVDADVALIYAQTNARTKCSTLHYLKQEIVLLDKKISVAVNHSNWARTHAEQLAVKAMEAINEAKKADEAVNQLEAEETGHAHEPASHSKDIALQPNEATEGSTEFNLATFENNYLTFNNCLRKAVNKKEFALEALKKSPNPEFSYQIFILCQEYQQDKDFVLRFIEALPAERSFEIYSISSVYAQDEDIALAIIKKDPLNFKKLPDNLKRSKVFVDKALSIRPEVQNFISQEKLMIKNTSSTKNLSDGVDTSLNSPSILNSSGIENATNSNIKLYPKSDIPDNKIVLIGIIDKLINNIKNGEGTRKTKCNSGNKLDQFESLKIKISKGQQALSTGALQDGILNDMKDICKIKRHKLHFWAVPHSVNELENLLIKNKIVYSNKPTVILYNGT